MRKLDWLILWIFAIGFLFCIYFLWEQAEVQIKQIEILERQAQKLGSLEQSLRIEQDNWLRMSDRAEEILKNDGDFKYQLGVVEDRLDNLSRRITKLEPEPPPPEDWGDMP